MAEAGGWPDDAVRLANEGPCRSTQVDRLTPEQQGHIAALRAEISSARRYVVLDEHDDRL